MDGYPVEAGQPQFGAAFAVSPVLTPFFLGTVAGGIASGRVPVPVAIGGGDLLTSWLNPMSVLGGVLAVGAAAYFAATYLCADAPPRRARRARRSVPPTGFCDRARWG